MAEQLLSIDTPLGPGKFELRSFSGTEGISQIFHYTADLYSDDHTVAFDDMVGQEVTIRVSLEESGEIRFIHGCVIRFARLQGDHFQARYQAEIVPRLWFLTREADCRIFQNKTVPEVVKEVLSSGGVRDLRFVLARDYQPREYCVQYRETSFNFVSRLMEQAGMFYFFRHEKNRHFLVIADSVQAHEPCPQRSRVRFEPVTGPGHAREEDAILSWRVDQEMRPGRYALDDFDFKNPRNDLVVGVTSRINQGGNQAWEIFDYPGEYFKRSDGEARVTTRMEEEEAQHTVVSGSSDCRFFCSGFRFELVVEDGDPISRDQQGTYVITSVSHSAQEPGSMAGASANVAGYSNSFTCIPLPVPFRPPRYSLMPVVQGCQTAIVVGPPGEEIHTDKYGRVKVQFPWDRVGKFDDNSSCWIRVAQPWAGKNWGGIWLPRIGQEVIVDFLEGDPDRPIITGRVYNAEQMPPYELPDCKTQSGVKSRSSKGGSPSQFNEIRFEDKKGGEEIYIHAERNLKTIVEANESRNVGGKRTTTIRKDETKTVKEGNQRVVLEQGHDDIQLKMGNQTTKVDLGKIETEALQSIELKVGTSSIKIDQAGVTIKGMLITLDAMAITNVKAAGMVNIKGGIVRIN